MDAPHLAVPEPEALFAGEHHHGGIEAGASPPLLVQATSELEGHPDGCPLPAPASGEVQDLLRLQGERQRNGELLQVVVLARLVEQAGPYPHHALLHEVNLGEDAESVPGVLQTDPPDSWSRRGHTIQVHDHLGALQLDVLGVRRGLQARPAPRCPTSPGRPFQPVRFSGITGTLTGTPGALPLNASTWAVARFLRSSPGSSPRSGPQ